MLRVVLQAADELGHWAALIADLVHGIEQWEPGEGGRESNASLVGEITAIDDDSA